MWLIHMVGVPHRTDTHGQGSHMGLTHMVKWSHMGLTHMVYRSHMGLISHIGPTNRLCRPKQQPTKPNTPSFRRLTILT